VRDLCSQSFSHNTVPPYGYNQGKVSSLYLGSSPYSSEERYSVIRNHGGEAGQLALLEVPDAVSFFHLSPSMFGPDSEAN
jgi:hypothetical protein